MDRNEGAIHRLYCAGWMGSYIVLILSEEIMNRTLKLLASSTVCGAMLRSTAAPAFAHAPPQG